MAADGASSARRNRPDKGRSRTTMRGYVEFRLGVPVPARRDRNRRATGRLVPRYVGVLVSDTIAVLAGGVGLACIAASGRLLGALFRAGSVMLRHGFHHCGMRQSWDNVRHGPGTGSVPDEPRHDGSGGHTTWWCSDLMRRIAVQTQRHGVRLIDHVEIPRKAPLASFGREDDR